MAPGVIRYPLRELGLCAGLTGARFVSTTEVYPDSPRTSPEACIAGILASRPEVVVLDVQLEGGTGLQVLQAVRAANPGIAFVVFSNNAGPAYRKRYLGEGAAGFLDKSVDFEQLPAAIQAAAPH